MHVTMACHIIHKNWNFNVLKCSFHLFSGTLTRMKSSPLFHRVIDRLTTSCELFHDCIYDSQIVTFYRSFCFPLACGCEIPFDSPHTTLHSFYFSMVKELQQPFSHLSTELQVSYVHGSASDGGPVFIKILGRVIGSLCRLCSWILLITITIGLLARSTVEL